MFRIRRIYDVTRQRDSEILEQVKSILREQFAFIDEADLRSLHEQLHNPLKYRFRTILFSAETGKNRLAGFAILLHSASPPFCFLDYISINPRRERGGVGGALYERVRSEARRLGATGVFMECLSDEPGVCTDKSLLRQNAARLKFYERFGALPIVGTAYETPIRDTDPCPPHLVFDPLGGPGRLDRRTARRVVRAILERRYGSSCPPGYIEMVVKSFAGDPVRLRERRYSSGEPEPPVEVGLPEDMRIALVVTDRHRNHHVRQQGYVESPARIPPIYDRITATGLFAEKPARHYGDRFIRSVHNPDFVEYLRRVCNKIKPGESVYPYVFPLRNRARKPVDLPVRAGYYCLDTFTPLNVQAYESAVRAVDCALSAADELLRAHRLAYALVRPPGHHAEKNAFGGFCYFNSTAIAADHLSRQGKVAVLDIDYHHGNGTQMIFYDRPDVLTVSLHGHPRFAYPYFTGFEDERGEGEGAGFNLNMPLPERLDGEQYRKHLGRALRRIEKFRPLHLVLALGLDTAKADPTGTWSLLLKDFEANGRMIGELRIPTLVVQEGGYRIRNLGINARSFFKGIWEGLFGASEAGRPSAAAR